MFHNRAASRSLCLSPGWIEAGGCRAQEQKKRRRWQGGARIDFHRTKNAETLRTAPRGCMAYNVARRTGTEAEIWMRRAGKNARRRKTVTWGVSRDKKQKLTVERDTNSSQPVERHTGARTHCRPADTECERRRRWNSPCAKQIEVRLKEQIRRLELWGASKMA
ncbi:hypothetical protein B0J12DRAFT_79161 [Macrophomina phaseolina]|uniref:Uncharacterized protein n=1 Tax=Macrophomina phaseolina TaxID=35725 RepID=A0ABQ8GBQ1_9PEZI|nr:hypothetical protein B0J12DRAFT_79161 [Macrophomina phaseolina]